MNPFDEQRGLSIMKRAVIGLGTNLGDRAGNLREAAHALSLLPGCTVTACSAVYETAPFDVPDQQPDYLNQCLLVRSALSPRALLGACLGIEAAMGRKRVGRHGARVIDLDLLLYEGENSRDQELALPHPGVLDRAFVLLPLADLFPEKTALGLDFSAAFSSVDKSSVRLFSNYEKFFKKRVDISDRI